MLYIMDEPTTGLHFDDMKKLLAMLQKLVNSGNTLVVVEHNIDVIKSADWIIDLAGRRRRRRVHRGGRTTGASGKVLALTPDGSSRRRLMPAIPQSQ